MKVGCVQHDCAECLDRTSKIEQLRTERDAALAANKDCIAWFEEAKAERDVLVSILDTVLNIKNMTDAQLEEFRAALERVKK